MGKIINFQKIVQQKAERELQNIEKELAIELEILGFDINSELNKYVIFDTSQYYELPNKNKREELTKTNVMKHLLTAFDMLVKLNEENAAIDVDNIITRLENHSY
jgi:hypothetical protein